MHKMKHTNAAIPTIVNTSPDRRRYHREALLAVLRILGIVGDDVAAVFAAVVKARGDRCGPKDNGLQMEAMAEALGLDGHALTARLLDVDYIFAMHFSINLLDPHWRRAALAERSADEIYACLETARTADRDTRDLSVGATDLETQLLLSSSIVDLLDIPPAIVAPSASPPGLDAAGQFWMTVLSAMAHAETGAHLAIRRSREPPRNAADLAAHIDGIGATLRIFQGGRNAVMSGILRAELHVPAEAPVVLIERDFLTIAAAAHRDDDDDGYEEPVQHHAGLDASELAIAPPAWLSACRCIYLWTVPVDGMLAASAASWIGACLGPLRHDPAWVRTVIAHHIGTDVADPTSPGIRALTHRLEDPRDAAAIASVARMTAAEGSMTIDHALVVLAASFSDRPPALVASSSRFDRRLLVCGHEAHRLLDHARQAAANGARVLAHGPPGGGKSAFARQLAREMSGGGPIRVITPADFLARGWGKMERLVRGLWRRAADEGEILIADEFEVICGRRIPGDTGNNALLIRSLTDEWLRALDEYPSVPLLATTNDILIDPAALRRFAFVLAFGDTLSPHQERLAWTSILERDPPSDWRACGAAVADVVMARHRCRMLGLSNAADLQEAIVAAKAARVGGESRAVGSARPNGTRH